VTGTTITSTRLGHSGEGLSVTKDTGRVPTGARDRHVGGGGRCLPAGSVVNAPRGLAAAGRAALRAASQLDGGRRSTWVECDELQHVDVSLDRQPRPPPRASGVPERG